MQLPNWEVLWAWVGWSEQISWTSRRVDRSQNGSSHAGKVVIILLTVIGKTVTANLCLLRWKCLCRDDHIYRVLLWLCVGKILCKLLTWHLCKEQLPDGWAIRRCDGIEATNNVLILSEELLEYKIDLVVAFSAPWWWKRYSYTACYRHYLYVQSTYHSRWHLPRWWWRNYQ